MQNTMGGGVEEELKGVRLQKDYAKENHKIRCVTLDESSNLSMVQRFHL